MRMPAIHDHPTVSTADDNDKLKAELPTRVVQVVTLAKKRRQLT
jgi:hypothetical protein